MSLTPIFSQTCRRPNRPGTGRFRRANLSLSQKSPQQLPTLPVPQDTLAKKPATVPRRGRAQMCSRQEHRRCDEDRGNSSRGIQEFSWVEEGNRLHATTREVQLITTSDK